MLDNKTITSVIPHDQTVKTFPFSALPISEIQKVYEPLHSKGILGKVESRNSYSDEPQFYVYACERSSGKRKTNVSYGFGGSEDEATAITHAITEAIEHYCILHERENLFVCGTYNELRPKAVDPVRFVSFSPQQLSKKKYRKFIVTHDTPLNWLEGYSLTKKKRVLIPASLAYANYSFKQHSEPIIRMPISTGAACGPTIDFALYRGLCEIIERDAYMISFLPEMPKKLITVDKNDAGLSAFIRKIERYNFELFLVDTTLDCPVSSVVCLLVDRTGSGPAVCAGLGCDLHMHRAIKTAVIEAARRHVSNRSLFFRSDPLPVPKKFSLDWFMRKKQQLWSAPHMIKQAEKFVENAKKIKTKDSKEFKTDKKRIDFLVGDLEKLNCEVFYIDMTIPEVEKVGLRVAKVICPETVPLWHDERYPYLGVKRLREVPKKYGVHPNLELNTQELMNVHPF